MQTILRENDRLKIVGLTLDDAEELFNHLKGEFVDFIFRISEMDENTICPTYTIEYDYQGNSYPREYSNLCWFLNGYFMGKREKIEWK